MSEQTNPEPRMLIVTRAQYEKGYAYYPPGATWSDAAKTGDERPPVENRQYAKVRDLDDGTILVLDPHADYLQHWALTSAEIEQEERQGSTTPIPWADPKDFAAASHSTLQELQAVQALGRKYAVEPMSPSIREHQSKHKSTAEPDDVRRTGVFEYRSVESRSVLDAYRWLGGFVAVHDARAVEEIGRELMRATGDGRRYVVQVKTYEQDFPATTRREPVYVDQERDAVANVPVEATSMVERVTRATVLLLDPHDAHVGEFVYFKSFPGSNLILSGHDLARTTWKRGPQDAWERTS